MCHRIAYTMAAATGTREEAERPTEWTGEADAEDEAEPDPIPADD